MPLFFIVSGMFISDMSLKASVRKNARNYLLPYLFGCIFQLIAVLVVASFTVGYSGCLSLVKEWVLAVFFAKGSTDASICGSMPAIGPLWFLPALFWGATFYAYIRRRFNSYLTRILLITLLFTLSYMSLRIVRLPLCIQVGLSSIVFLWIGDMINKYNLIEILIKDKFSIFAALSLWALVIKCGSIYMNAGSYSMGLTSVVGAFCAVLIILSFMKKTGLGGGNIGKTTLLILILHSSMQYVFNKCEISFSFLHFSPLINFIIESTICVSGTLLINSMLSKVTFIRQILRIK